MVRKCFRFGLNAGRNIFLFPEPTEYEKQIHAFSLFFHEKRFTKN